VVSGAPYILVNRDQVLFFRFVESPLQIISGESTSDVLFTRARELLRKPAPGASTQPSRKSTAG
jgi:hypothetical protein